MQWGWFAASIFCCAIDSFNKEESKTTTVEVVEEEREEVEIESSEEEDPNQEVCLDAAAMGVEGVNGEAD